MANYKYIAYSQSGEKVKGFVEALTKNEAVAKIKETCPIVEEIKEIEGQVVKQKIQKVKVKALSLMCERFAIVLNVGLPLVQSLEMMANQTDDKNLKHILEEVHDDVAMGRSLTAALSLRSEAFPSIFIETVRAGEETGDLSTSFKRLSTYFEKTSKMQQKVKSALTYPALVSVVGVIVMGIIMVVAVPSFTKAFSSLGSELPGITKFVMWLSDFLKKYGLFFIIVITSVFVGIKLYSKTEQGEEFLAKTALKLPLISTIVQMSNASQFAQTMSMMVLAGMPIIRGLEISGKGMTNYVMRRDVLDCVAGIEAGRTMAFCLGQSEYLPRMLVEMTTIGESTGSLESTLNTVGDYYENEVQIATSKALSALEPAIIGVLAVFVMVILLSVYLPMFNMYGSM